MSGRTARSRLPILVIFIGLLLIAAAVASLFFFPKVAAPAPTDPVSGGIPDPQIERVSLAEAIQAFDTGAAVFVDVRSADAYAANHIPGARSIPLDELEARLDELEREDWIITY